MKDNLVNDTISRAAALKGLEDFNIASFYEENEHSKEAYTETKAMLKALPSVRLAQDLPKGCTDTISRQAAIETVRKAKDKSEAHRMLIQMPPVQPEWIPCNKRLPEEDGLYLVTRQDFGWNCTEYREIDIAKYDSDGWYKVDNISSITVLAWCELGVLKPWEGEKNDG